MLVEPSSKLADSEPSLAEPGATKVQSAQSLSEQSKEVGRARPEFGRVQPGVRRTKPEMVEPDRCWSSQTPSWPSAARDLVEPDQKAVEPTHTWANSDSRPSFAGIGPRLPEIGRNPFCSGTGKAEFLRAGKPRKHYPRAGKGGDGRCMFPARGWEPRLACRTGTKTPPYTHNGPATAS